MEEDFFRKYQCLPAALSKFLILAYWTFQFFNPAVNSLIAYAWYGRIAGISKPHFCSLRSRKTLGDWRKFEACLIVTSFYLNYRLVSLSNLCEKYEVVELQMHRTHAVKNCWKIERLQHTINETVASVKMMYWNIVPKEPLGRLVLVFTLILTILNLFGKTLEQIHSSSTAQCEKNNAIIEVIKDAAEARTVMEILIGLVIL